LCLLLIEVPLRYAVVATVNYVLLLDIQTKQVKVLESDQGEYYGVSWFPKGTELALSRSGLNNSDLVDLRSYALSEVGWVSLGGDASSRCLSAPHQILCAPDGRVVCTNTGRNAISVLDMRRPGVVTHAKISDSHWDRLSPAEATGDHLNSVFIEGDRLYVLAHGFAAGSRLGVFSYPDLDLIDVQPLAPRTGMHNIWITSEGQRVACDSNNGTVVDIDVATPLWNSGGPIFTRGLAATPDHVLVGESQVASRGDRRHSMSGVWVLDRHTWKALDYIALGPYGAVHEIRILDVPDLAHHATVFAGLEHLIAANGALGDFQRMRLDAADLAYRHSSLWDQFQLVFGGALYLEDGRRRAEANSLCCILRAAAPSSSAMRFDYTLDVATDASHVSAIAGYQGAGADSHMTAFLLEKVNPQQAALSVWRHDGTAWTRLPAFSHAGLPVEGRFEYAPTATGATVSINGQVVLRVRAQEVGLDACDQGVGIRWTAATVGVG